MNMQTTTSSPRSLPVNRRGFLQLGGVGLLSMGLVQSLRAAETPGASTRRRTARACILLFQVGGPYQCDTFDPKPHAPEEVRGPFRPIATSEVGVRITEALPRLAQNAHRFAIVRTVHHLIRCHNPAIYCALVGREATDPMAVTNRTHAARTDHPHYASVIARVRPGASSMPHHVLMPDVVYNGPAKSPGQLAGYLGAAYDPMILGADPNDANFRVEGVAPQQDVGRTRLQRRRSLLQALDAEHRRLEASGSIERMGTFYRRAFDLLTSPQAKRAFAIDEEPARVRDRYGRTTSGQGALLARRLVEAGVPFVTVFSHTRVERNSWDTHNRHYELSRQSLLPTADQSFSALLEDLDVRGMLDETLVVWMGEFGRTPRMGVNFSNNTNNVGGRDHWCNCYSVVLAGGGVRGGQVVGTSDAQGAYPQNRAVHVSDLAATIYQAMGIDPRARLTDIQGQLRFICEGHPVRELF